MARPLASLPALAVSAGNGAGVHPGDRGRTVRRLLHLYPRQSDTAPDPGRRRRRGDRGTGARPALPRHHGPRTERLAASAALRHPGGGARGRRIAAGVRHPGRAHRRADPGRCVGCVRFVGGPGGHHRGRRGEPPDRDTDRGDRYQPAPAGRSARIGDLLHHAGGGDHRLRRRHPAQRARRGVDRGAADRVHRRLRLAGRVRDRGPG